VVVLAVVIVALASVALTTFGLRLKSKQVHYETPPDLLRADDAENQPSYDPVKARDAISRVFGRSGIR
jgi:hypothetical protein